MNYLSIWRIEVMIINKQLIHVRQKELLDEAERYRLIRSVNPSPDRPKLIYAKAMNWIGNLFLIWGTRLTIRIGEKNIIGEPGLVDDQIQGAY